MRSKMKTKLNKTKFSNGIQKPKRGSVKNNPISTNIKREKNKIFLVSPDGEKLAVVKVIGETESSINLSTWRAYVKHKGYGKELIQKIVKSKPNLYMVTTNGLSKEGEPAMQQALKGFKITDWRTSGAGAFIMFMRQDAIDYYVELQEKSGRRSVIQINPELHSRNDKTN